MVFANSILSSYRSNFLIEYVFFPQFIYAEKASLKLRPS